MCGRYSLTDPGDLLVELGLPRENIVLVDEHGVALIERIANSGRDR